MGNAVITDRTALLRQLDMAAELAEALRTGRQVVISLPSPTAWFELLARMGVEFASASKLKKMGLEPKRGAKPAIYINSKRTNGWDAWIIGIQTKPIAAPVETERA